MFVSFSKTLAKFGGFRIGCGLRITKKNAAWAWFVIMCVALVQLMWYAVLLVGWLYYALFYGIYWCIKAIIQKIKEYRAERMSRL